jgi:uncharacterized membrane protein YvbJ
MSGETKFCKHCGEQIDKECVVCPKCGKQVEELKYENDKNIIINNSASSSASMPEKRKKKYNIFIDLLLILFTGGLWIIWMIIRPKYEY